MRWTFERIQAIFMDKKLDYELILALVSLDYFLTH